MGWLNFKAQMQREGFKYLQRRLLPIAIVKKIKKTTVAAGDLF